MPAQPQFGYLFAGIAVADLDRWIADPAGRGVDGVHVETVPGGRKLVLAELVT